jgi:hypothetical protein
LEVRLDFYVKKRKNRIVIVLDRIGLRREPLMLWLAIMKERINER